MTALLEFDQVKKRFGRIEVLREVSFSVAAAESVALVGINGAGKTTLIRGLLDLSRIDHGNITIDGMAHRLTAARRRLAYLGERFVPPDFATGHEFLSHLLALHGLPYDTLAVAREASALALDYAALSQPARSYSKGMAQKLGLMSCILSGCPVLVLDEPMSGLDPQARVLFKQRLTALRKAGVSLFFSTHLLSDLESLCDRIAVLHGGRIVFDGSPAQCLASANCDDLETAFLQLLEAAA